MEKNILVVSPETKELIPYYSKVWESNYFSFVIDDLKRKGNPSNFTYYDGKKNTKIKPTDPFDLYRSNPNGLILALSEFKHFPTLTIPENHHLMLLLSPDFSQIIPYMATKNTTLNNILDYLMNKYQLLVSIQKYTMISNILSKVELRDNDFPVLFFEDKPRVLVLEEKPDFLKGLEILENLSDEQAFPFFLTLPTNDIERLCHLSKNLKKWCQDEPLWRQLVERDFGLKERDDEEFTSWIDFYQSIINDEDKLLVIGARLGNQALIDRAFDIGVMISSEALDAALRRGDKSLANTMINYGEALGHNFFDNELLDDAATYGYIGLLKWLIDIGEILEEDFIDDRWIALKSAAHNGHLDIIKTLLNNMEPIEPEFFDELMIIAAEAGNEDIVRFFVDTMEEALVPNRTKYYNGALEAAAKNGHKEIVDLLRSRGATI